MRIAVLGATGMLGHHAAKAVIERGHDLTIIHRAGSDLSKVADLTYDSAVADLDDLDGLTGALADIDGAINCAAHYPTVPRPWRDEVATATAQMDRFYDACATNAVQKIVYLGGAIALPKRRDGQPGDESLDYPGEPPTTNSYVRAKWAMDRQAQERAEAGLPVVVGIPTMSFGEYDFGPSTGTLLTKVANQDLPGYVRGNRNVVYAGDAGRGLVLALEHGQPGERYLLTGTDVSMDDLVGLMARIAGIAMPRALPMFVARLVGKMQALRYRLLRGDPPVISETAIAVMAGGQFLSGEKAKRELGYEPSVSLEETIERAYRWFQDVGYVGR